MKELIKCHFSYLFSKTVVIIIISTLTIVFLGYLFSLNLGSSLMLEEERLIVYLVQGTFITKLMLILLSSFVGTIFFLSNHDQYCYLIVSSTKTRLEYFITKVISVFLFLLILVMLLLFVFLFLGVIFLKLFVFDINYIIYFYDMFLISMTYCLYSVILVQMANNIFICIIPYILYLSCDIILDSKVASNFGKLFSFFFPTLGEVGEDLYYGSNQVILLIFVLLAVNVLIYQKRDL